MTNYNPEQYIGTQRNEWNGVASAWEKWDEWLEVSMASCNTRLLEQARVGTDHSVLDLGSGTGYPAILAAQKVGGKGRVVGLDLSEEMLSVARKKSNSQGLENIVFQTCDVSSIPFEDNSFDAVSSRFCLMFLPFLNKTLSEIHRVLKRSAVFSAAVWASKEKNPSLSLPIKILQEFIDIPKPDPSQPGIFHLSKSGDLMNRMKAVGFNNISEELFPVKWGYSSGLKYMECLKEIAAPLKPLFEKLSPDARQEVENRLVEEIEKYRGDGNLSVPGEVLIVSGRK